MRIVGSLTTIPPRLNLIEPVVKTLLNQSRPLDLLYINVPYKSRRGGDYNVKELGSFILNHDRICINRCDEDHGPLTKILPTLLKEKDPDTLILTFDDDVLINDKVVEILEQKSIQYPNSALSFAGIIFGYFPFYYQVITNNTKDIEVDWIMGTSVCAYRRKMLNPETLLSYKDIEDENFKNMMLNNDDLTISSEVHKNGYNTISIGEKAKKYMKDSGLRNVSPLYNGIKPIIKTMKVALYLKNRDELGKNIKNHPLCSGGFWIFISIIMTLALIYILYSIYKIDVFTIVIVSTVFLVGCLVIIRQILRPNG